MLLRLQIKQPVKIKKSANLYIIINIFYYIKLAVIR